MQGFPARLFALLPHGGSLPGEEWQVRHRLLVRVNWGIVALLIPYSVFRGYGPAHAVTHGAPILALALFASAVQLDRRVRSVACALSLLTAAAVFVHASDGLIESHFSFFVFIAALTLYEDWLPFLAAIVFVLLHHGVFGMLAPHEVFEGDSLSGNPWVWAAIHAAFVGAAGFAAVVAWRFNEKIREELRRAVSERTLLAERLDALARHDPLTGVANRRAWHERLVEELRRAARSAEPLSVALVDFDGFKEVNDSQGHQGGDRLLRSAASAWQGAVRATDYLGRIGGDEFAVILPACGADDALEIVARMLGAMPDDQTCSAGVATWDGQQPLRSFLRCADDALYAAKEAGRNRALAAVERPPAPRGSVTRPRRISQPSHEPHRLQALLT